MSKLSDINEVGVISGTREPKENPYSTHVACHQSFHNNCNECHKEKRAIGAWKTVNKPKSLLQELKEAVDMNPTDFLGHV